jgi:hypothetical protein
VTVVENPGGGSVRYGPSPSAPEPTATSQVIRDLVTVLTGEFAPANQLALRQATVVALGAAPGTVNVKVAGSTTIPGARYLETYVPRVGDTVWALRNGPDTLVVGALKDSRRTPGAMVRKTDNPNTAHSTYTPLDWSSHAFAQNQDATVWDASQPSRFYAPVAGRYAIGGNVNWATNATGGRIVSVRKNAAGSGAGGTSIDFWTTAAVTGLPTSMPFSLTDVYMAAGDYLEVFANHTAGVGVTVGVGASGGITSTFSMSFVGPV